MRDACVIAIDRPYVFLFEILHSVVDSVLSVVLTQLLHKVLI